MALPRVLLRQLARLHHDHMLTCSHQASPSLLLCRWGNTALDEARRNQAEQVVAYLEARSAAATAAQVRPNKPAGLG